MTGRAVICVVGPAAEMFHSWPIHSGGVYAGIIRHMRPTRDGNLLIHQSSTNRVILVTLPCAATGGRRRSPARRSPVKPLDRTGSYRPLQRALHA
jgi:hypothetical protein